MSRLTSIEDHAQLKLIAEPQRLAILRQLMAGPATLSQLGGRFGVSAARVRHHLKALEAGGLVELVETRQVRGFVEKYYRANAGAYSVNLVVLPSQPSGEPALILGSNDPALGHLPHLQGLARPPIALTILALDSLSGLLALRQEACQLAGCHLLDPHGSEYNRGTVLHLFPGEEMVLLHLGRREQGLLVAPGNPRRIRDLEDLARPDVRMVNRSRGSGTRVWLDRALGERGIAPQALRGYGDEVGSHAGVVSAVQSGKSDAGLGLIAAGRQAGLEAVPLFEEPYDLVVNARTFSSEAVQRFCEYLNSAPFRAALDELDGYRAAPAAGQAEPVR